MRNIDSSEITKNIKEMCIEANHFLAPDMERVFKKAKENEESKLGCQILEQLDENLKIAAEDMIPICQDTGMAVVFIEIGQDIHIEGENLEDAINEGVRQGYVDGYLRKSVVSDPIIRENTKDNTPAVIHYSIVPGENIKITVAPKGFGSENMSKVFMLKPADGIEGVKDAVLTAVKEAGPNACPPMVVGVGIGGTFEKCAILAKKALARPADSNSEIPYVKVNGMINYNDLYDKKIKNSKGLYIYDVIQNVNFYLNERGCNLSSKATMVTEYMGIGEDTKYCYFQDTFIIFMKEANSDQPYFALKVDNNDILEKIEETDEPKIFDSTTLADREKYYSKYLQGGEYKFFEDEKYEYYYPTQKTQVVQVYFKNGDIMTAEEALKQGKISMDLLDKYEIEYFKKEK